MALVRKMIVIRASTTIQLPSDWHSVNNGIWVWGPGGAGADQSDVGILTGAGGGGGGGFSQSLSVGGSAGDIWTINVGIKNGGRIDANATWVKNPSLSYLAFANAGENAADTAGAGLGTGGIGGGGSSQANSNCGGFGDVGGGGGGGGAPGGPHTAVGNKGGTAADGFHGGGGGGGAGACGNFSDQDESQATNGADATSANGASGGSGYYGTGAGSGGVSVGGDGTSNTGGGGAGGHNSFNGGNGAGWDEILTLPVEEWILAPFDWETTASTRWAELSSGTVPGGGGGGGGGRSKNGGNGGFPGGGGGGAGNGGLGGDGADGLVIIFYDGVEEILVGGSGTQLEPLGCVIRAQPYALEVRDLNSVLELGPFRFVEQKESDETSMITTLVLGLTEVDTGLLIEIDLSTASDLTDLNQVFGATVDLDTQVDVLGDDVEIDMGEGVDNSDDFTLELLGNDDGSTYPGPPIEFKPEVLAPIDDRGSTKQYSPTGYSFLYHRVRLKATEIDEKFQVKFVDISGQLTGRLF